MTSPKRAPAGGLNPAEMDWIYQSISPPTQELDKVKLSKY